MNSVILIGYFAEVVELCEKCGYSIAGIVDSVDTGVYPYLGTDDTFMHNCSRYTDTPLVITPDDPAVRSRLFESYKRLGFMFKTLISPDAVISKSASISEGCIIQSLCHISSNTLLEECVRVNTGANVMHDVQVEKFAVVAPNAVVLGHVSIGSQAYIGANSTVLPHLRVGNASIVGAGAVVTKDVADSTVVVGVPAHVLDCKD